MRNASVWQRVLGLVATVIEGIVFDDDADAIVVSVRPRKGARRRCGRCGRRSPWYDRGGGRRRWRGLDLGTVRVFLEADAPRVRCRDHGVTVVQVPWARHDAGHTRAFDDTVAWLAVHCSKTAVVELMRIAWRSVGAIVTRVADDAMAGVDRLEGLRRIGIDEISYKKGHRYLTVVVDHDTRRLVWAAAGRDRATLGRFFDELGDERAALITHVSADAADWIAYVVAERCPNAVICADAFHVVAWATEALDEVRRDAWNDARRLARLEPKRSRGRPPKGATPPPGGERARALKNARYALWKNPEDLTDHQHDKLAWIAKTDPRLHRAYLLKEGLRHVFKVKGEAGKEALDRWLAWAARCRIPSFVKLGARIRRHRASINAALEHNLSNGLVESTNTKIRLLQRMAYGFKSPDALIALAMLSVGGHRPDLPLRNAA
ncbi:MAG: ISL3 family transposase [Actinomycetota bacterium]|nr:ISL3 family transposase [Actinomycetota bacterium]